MKLWGGRFSEQYDEAAWKLNASIGFDQRLAVQDVRGSLAWAMALKDAGALKEREFTRLNSALQTIAMEVESRTFTILESDEDIHTAVERRLGEIVGPLAGKLHTGRSRNDQVATDLRMWLLDNLPYLEKAITSLQAVLVERASADMGVVMPGYTHLQRAQPILLSHWWLAHFWPLQRDLERLRQLRSRASVLPLGSGALAGVPFPIDRQALARNLGFDQPSQNSYDAVSDRDFVAEFLFFSALAGVHLSRMAEMVVIFSSAEFGFFILPDAYATGSSLMPQKKNPDVFELARAKAGGLIGALAGLMATLKGLPSAYDKDLQEDKVPLFLAYDSLMALLPVFAGVLRSITVLPEKMKSAVDAGMLSTDLADYLVERGIPFREAHELVGNAVQLAADQGKPLDAISLEDFQSLNPAFGPEVYDVFDPVESLKRRNAIGGTAPDAVLAQLQSAKDVLSRR